jgi:hypothetical protein
VLELAGIRDVLAKSLGTTNPINMAKATVDGLKRLRRPEDVARARGKSVKEVLPLPRAPQAHAEASASDDNTGADAISADEQPREESPEETRR